MHTYSLVEFQYWTIGKVIDKIAEAARLKNDNNKKMAARVSK